ncbi:MAG: hypothetical protein WBH31_01880, partial [Promethearchaeia archaeon]
MAKKDIAIGILLITVVGLAGGLGFLYIIGPQLFGTPPEGPTNLFGLPEDWNSAPNSSYFMLYNQTGTNIKITLKDILNGVSLALEEQEAGGAAINEYKKVIYPYTFLEPSSGLYITGVDILDILEAYNTNFGWDLRFTSGYGHILEMTTGDIITKMYHNNKDPVIIAIAANKEWLEDSPVGKQWGNFSIVGKLMPSAIYDLERVDVLSNWSVEVVVNGTLEYTIDPMNMRYNEYDDIYHYDRSDWWNFNRHYWGRNISEILSYTTALGKNYSVRVWSVDDFASPRPFREFKEYRYNNTEIEYGVIPPRGMRYNTSYNNRDMINLTIPDDYSSG